MVLHLSFSGAQADLLELLAVAVATQGLHLGSFQDRHTEGDAGFFQGPHQLTAVVDLTVLLKQQPRLPAGG
jgi:hypothetical protein